MSKVAVGSELAVPVSLELELQKEKQENLLEIDRREAIGYDVVALMRKNPDRNLFFLVVELRKSQDKSPEPIELPQPTPEKNTVKDALEHPAKYFEAAGLAPEEIFDNLDLHRDAA